MTFSLPEIVRVESTRRQRTLARRVDVAGFGFWTSRDVVFSFLPADDDSGVRFFRVDLPNSAPIPAHVANRIRKPRQTSLAGGDAQVDMIEHVLAALRGAGIDNCDVLVDAPEAPGLDGSAAPFLEAFLEAGVVEQTRERARLKVVFPGRFGDDTAFVDVLPSAPQSDDPNDNAEFNENNDSNEKSVYDFGSPCYEYRLIYDVPRSIPNQMAKFEFTPETFRREIAPARTFLTFEEASYLREQGICGRVGPRDVLVYGADGPIENCLRFENECARHKILDMFGDFALAPFDWDGEFRACKTGHQQNADALTKALEIAR